MANADLRKEADDLEARLEAGRPGRREARERTVGQLLTSGQMTFPVGELDDVQEMFAEESDVRQLFDLEVLEQHGYRFYKGTVIGPPSWPRGAPPRLGSALQLSSAESGWASAGSGSSGGGGGSISRAEGRRQVLVSRAYVDWSDAICKLKVCTVAQERRTWMLGRFFAGGVIKSANLRKRLRQAVAEGRNPSEIELWSEDDVRADYTPEELGEGCVTSRLGP